MNEIDALLAGVLVIAMASGYRRGLITAALRLLALFGSLLTALIGYRFAARSLLAHAPSLGVWIWPLSFIACWLLAQIILSALGGAIVRAIPRRVHAHGINRALGVLPGLVYGVIAASYVSVMLLTVPLGDGLSTRTRDSKLATRLAAPADWLECQLAPILEPGIRRTLQAITVQPESRDRVDLPFSAPSARVRADLESAMLELVNAERARRGRRPLAADPDLAQVARAHCRDMLTRSYFAHVTPDGQDLSDRMHVAKLRFLTAGENLALAPTIEVAHENLMRSPGHRDNLLRDQFGRVGIGVLDAGRHGLMITQNFRN